MIIKIDHGSEILVAIFKYISKGKYIANKCSYVDNKAVVISLDLNHAHNKKSTKKQKTRLEIA